MKFLKPNVAVFPCILIYSKLETISSLLFAILYIYVHLHHISLDPIFLHLYLADGESFQVTIVHNIHGMLAFPLTISILNNNRSHIS